MKEQQKVCIGKYLTNITKIDSPNARSLLLIIRSTEKFDLVMRTIEGNSSLLNSITSDPTDEAIQFFCDKLMDLLSPGKKAPSEQSKSGEDLEEDKRYQELNGIGKNILYMHTQEKWWKDMPSLADKSRVFFGNFLNYYKDMDPAADGDDEDSEDSEDGVRVYISPDRGDRQEDDSAYHDGFGYDPEDEENYWEDDDDDEEEDTSSILPHEVEVISALSDMVTSYFGFIDNEAHTRPIKKILLDEKKRGKWESVASIMEDFSDLLRIDYMTKQLNKHNTLFTKNMKTLKVKYDAFQISLDR